MSDYDNGLLSRLKVDLKDYERGTSGASKCENVLVPKKQYIRMAELAIVGIAELQFKDEVL